VPGQASPSELHLRAAEADRAGTGPAACPEAVDDAARVTSTLTAFVNAHIMARGRPIEPADELEAAGVDSMGLLKILLFVESEFGFWMPDADLLAENVSSLRALASYVSRRRSLA
jgi:acyl carrier protein